MDMAGLPISCALVATNHPPTILFAKIFTNSPKSIYYLFPSFLEFWFISYKLAVLLFTPCFIIIQANLFRKIPW